MDVIAIWACLQTARVLPVEEMAHKAAVIGVAEVQGSSVRREPGNNMIFTDYRLRFSEVWKGQPFGSFVLSKAGGRIGDDAAAMAGHDYELRPGESVVVFAAASPPGRHSVLGLRQGLYRVGAGPERPLRRESEPLGARLPLRSLREKVFRALGRALPPEEPPPRMKRAAPPAEAPGAEDPPPAPDVEGGPPPAVLAGAAVLALLLLVVGLLWLRRQHARP